MSPTTSKKSSDDAEDDDIDDDDDDEKLSTSCTSDIDPERLKAFNVSHSSLSVNNVTVDCEPHFVII